MPRPRRSDSYDPAARVPMSFRVRPELKARMERASAVSGRSLMAEMEFALEFYYENQRRMGGPRAQHLLQLLAEIAQMYFPNESDWLDDRVGWDMLRAAWSQALDVRAPPTISREERIARTRRLVDELRVATDPSRREHLIWVLMNLAQDEHLPVHVRDEAFGAASVARPADQPPTLLPFEITIQEMIACGRGIADELARATDPRLRKHLRSRLAAMARLERLPQGVREEFKRAAESPVVRLPPSTPPSGPAPNEWRPPHVSLFDAAWLIATTRAQQDTAEPDETQIGKAFAADPTLFAIAGMEGIARIAATVLAYRSWIEEERAKARPSPQAEPAEPSSKQIPTKRPRAARKL